MHLGGSRRYWHGYGGRLGVISAAFFFFRFSILVSFRDGGWWRWRSRWMEVEEERKRMSGSETLD